MSGPQWTFAIIGSTLTLAGLVWGITWAVRSFRKSGAEVSAELGQGYVDEFGILHVYFRDGRSKIMRIDGDPWDRRARPEKTPAKKKKRRAPGAPDLAHDWMPVNAIFVRNSGRAAVTVSRCLYTVDLNLGRVLNFEPSPEASPWGDLLPKRIEAGHEIVVLHEKEAMSGFLNGVLRDHGVFQTVYGVYLELGNGDSVFAGPPIGIQATMNDDEYAEVSRRLSREVYEHPGTDRRKRWRPDLRYLRWHHKNVVMEEDLHPDQIRTARAKAAEKAVGRPRPPTEEEKRHMP
jgi:hypothetical protein